MVHVSFTSNLERHLTCPSMDVDGDSVRDALEAVFSENPRLRGYLLDDQGRLRKHVNIFVNQQLINDRVRLSDTLARKDKVFVIQALSGG